MDCYAFIEKIKMLMSTLDLDPTSVADLITCVLILFSTKFFSLEAAFLPSAGLMSFLERHQISLPQPFSSENYFEFKQVANLLDENKLLSCFRFFQLMCPYFVLSTHEFANIKDSAIIFILHFIVTNDLNSSSILADDFSFFDQLSDEQKTYVSEVLSLTPDDLNRYYLAVKTINIKSYSVKINGNVNKALKIYFKKKVPISKLIYDFSLVKQYKDELNQKKAPWLYVHNIKLHEGLVGGLDAAETLFDQGAYSLKDEPATDVIRVLLYRENRKDTAFECGFLFSILQQNLFKKCRILIFNPSPDFLIKCQENVRNFDAEIFYVMPSHDIASVYNIEFNTKNFLSFDSLSSGTSYDIIIYISPSSKLPYDFPDLQEVFPFCANSGKLFALLPSVFVDHNRQHFFSSLNSNDFSVFSVLLLPDNVTDSNPHHTMFLTLAHSDNAPNCFPVYSASSNENGTSLSVQFPPVTVITQQYLNSKSTLRKMIQQQEQKMIADAAGRTIKRRNVADLYPFSQEIQLSYSIISSRKNRFAGKAYYTGHKTTGLRTKRATPIIERGLRAETREQVIIQLEDVAYYPEVAPAIVKDINDYYNGNFPSLSLKSIWFCCREQLQKTCPTYDDSLCRDLFRHRFISDLHPAEAYLSDYQDCMAQSYNCTWDQVDAKIWIQLNLVLDTALTLKYVQNHPLNTILHPFVEQQRHRQLEVRNALIKRSFTSDEERELLKHISAETKIPFDDRNAMQFEVDSKWLLCAIRLFTGISIREACALTWKDFFAIPETDVYSLLLSKQITPNGESKNYTAQEKNKYRIIPLPKILTQMLHNRKEYLAAANLTNAYKSNAPIVLAKEPANSEDQLSPCSPRNAAGICRKLLKAVHVPDNIVFLPDAESADQAEINLSKYTGDIFRSNYKFRLRHSCMFTNGEVNYVLGIEPPDTFSRHYCDYTNDFVQLSMAEKLNRWTAAILSETFIPKLEVKQVTTLCKDQLTTSTGSILAANVTINIPPECTGDGWRIALESEHGFSGYLTFYENQD